MKKHLLLLTLILLCSSYINAQTSNIDTVSFEKPTDNNSILIDSWSFKVGDDTTWSDKDFDDRDWKTFNPKYKGEDADFLIKNGFKNKAWFRKQLYFDSTNFTFPFALRIEHAGAMEVYIDGIKKDTYGEIEKNGKERFENQVNPLLFTIKQPGIHTLALRFSKSNIKDSEDGVANGFKVALYTGLGVYIDRESTLIWTSSFLLTTGIFFFALFFIHILMFIFYRKDQSNFIFAIFNIGMSCMWICAYIKPITTVISHQQYLLYLLIIAGFISGISLSTFTNSIFSKIGLRYKIIFAFGVISLFFLLGALLRVPLISKSRLSAITAILFFAIVLLEAVIIITNAIFRKIPGARILGIGVLFFIFSIIAIITYIYFNKGIIINAESLISRVIFILIFVLVVYSIPLSLSAYLAWKVSNTNRHLEVQIVQVESLSNEKQSILENQNQLLESKVNERTIELQIEKKKSDDLLLNILPLEIAEELKQTGTSQAQNHDEVSVLFTDFVNFTKTSEQLGVDELLNELNINFTSFDNIMEKYGMEKIKTIGDAYLAVSGLPVSNELHAKNAVLAALEIIDFVDKRKSKVSYGLDIRIGINSGPLIAGIIGVKKFAYDIWGDTVNIAARMEQSGEAGKVNISENTYSLVKQDFSFEHRGKIEAKNKGEMDMYFVKHKIMNHEIGNRKTNNV